MAHARFWQLAAIALALACFGAGCGGPDYLFGSDADAMDVYEANMDDEYIPERDLPEYDTEEFNSSVEDYQPENNQPEDYQQIPKTDVVVFFVLPKVGANLRAGPGTNYARVGGLKQGTLLSVDGIDANGTWCRLTSGAWIYAELVGIAPKASSGVAPVEPAPASGSSINDRVRAQQAAVSGRRQLRPPPAPKVAPPRQTGASSRATSSIRALTRFTTHRAARTMLMSSSGQTTANAGSAPKLRLSPTVGEKPITVGDAETIRTEKLPVGWAGSGVVLGWQGR